MYYQISVCLVEVLGGSEVPDMESCRTWVPLNIIRTDTRQHRPSRMSVVHSNGSGDAEDLKKLDATYIQLHSRYFTFNRTIPIDISTTTKSTIQQQPQPPTRP